MLPNRGPQRTVTTMPDAPGPLLSPAQTLSQAGHVIRGAWLPLLLVSAAAWLPFAIVSALWTATSVDLNSLRELVTLPEGRPAVLTQPAVFLTGIPLVLATYVTGTSWAGGASTLIADSYLRGSRLPPRKALVRAGRRLHRTVSVYLVLSGLAVLFGAIAFLSGGLAAWAGAPYGTALSLLLGISALLTVGALGGGLWLILYARWDLALAASVLSNKRPLRVSAALTSGQRLGVLWRVLAITLLVLTAASVFGGAALILQFGPGPALALALVGRVLLSVASGAFTCAGITPLYRAVEHAYEAGETDSGRSPTTRNGERGVSTGP